MGAEAMCAANFNGEVSEGTAQLETGFLLFRGGFRVKVPLQAIQEVSAAKGQLQIQFDQGALRLDLGAVKNHERFL